MQIIRATFFFILFAFAIFSKIFTDDNRVLVLHGYHSIFVIVHVSTTVDVFIIIYPRKG